MTRLESVGPAGSAMMARSIVFLVNRSRATPDKNVAARSSAAVAGEITASGNVKMRKCHATTTTQPY